MSVCAAYYLGNNVSIACECKLQDPECARFPANAACDMVHIVLGELMFGISKSLRRDHALKRLQALQQVVSLHALPIDAVSHYGDIRAELERAGTPIGNNDLWISAHARAAGLTLVTNNLREFSRVPGLKLENWVE